MGRYFEIGLLMGLVLAVWLNRDTVKKTLENGWVLQASGWIAGTDTLLGHVEDVG